MFEGQIEREAGEKESEAKMGSGCPRAHVWQTNKKTHNQISICLSSFEETWQKNILEKSGSKNWTNIF